MAVQVYTKEFLKDRRLTYFTMFVGCVSSSLPLGQLLCSCSFAPTRWSSKKMGSAGMLRFI